MNFSVVGHDDETLTVRTGEDNVQVETLTIEEFVEEIKPELEKYGYKIVKCDSLQKWLQDLNEM